MKNKEIDKSSDNVLKKDVEKTEMITDIETKTKKKVKRLKLKKPKLKKQKDKKEKIKKEKTIKEKVKVPKKQKKYKLLISVIIIVVSFIFILLGIFVGLVGTGVINLNKDKGPVYYSLEEKLKVGHYVVYDAGVWEEDKEIPGRKNQFTFGGYTKDASRNDGVTCNYLSDEDYLKNKKSGWRVFSIEEGIVTLIHDGISMCYYHGYGNNTNDKSVKILSGNDENINFDDYLDNKYASSVRILSKEDIDKYYGEDSSYKKIEDNMISVGIPYWLATKKGTNFMWYVTEGGTVATDQVGVYGVRVLVTLGTGVKTTGLTNNKEWILAIDTKDAISEE